MRSGTALPKIILHDRPISFKRLKDQKMLKDDSMPRCNNPVEFYPYLSENIGSKIYFSEEGVFVRDTRYFRPGAYCVDGQANTEDDEEDSVITVVLCDKKGRSMGECEDKDQNCFTR